MAFLDINGRELSGVYPGLFDALGAVRERPQFEIAGAKVRGHTLRLGPRFVHSSFDPVTEAERQYGTTRGRFDLVILAGLGAGHLLEAALADPAVKAVRVFETDLALLRLVLQHREIHRQLSDPRVRLVWRVEDVSQLTDPLDLISIRTVTLLVDASFAAGSQARYLKNGFFKSRIDARITELLTYGRMGMVWADNFIANYPLRGRFRPATELSGLVGKNRDRVLLVGAGPSLEGLLPSLRRDQDRYLVVAIDTIAKHLERRGIPPDIVVSVDSQAVSGLHFRNYDPQKAVFVFDVLSPRPVVSRFLERAYFCRSSNPLSVLFGPGIPECREGLSAGNTAVELLHGLGAGTIYLAGVDLSFPKDRDYTGGNYFSLYQAARVDRTSPMDGFFLRRMAGRRSEKAATLSGGETNTVPVMRQYAAALDSFIAGRPGLKVFSLSGDMIAMKNVRIADSVPPAEASAPPGGGRDRTVRASPRGTSPFPAGETGRAADLRLPEKWTREALNRFFYPAIYALMYKRSGRAGGTADPDGNWAFGVLERKAGLIGPAGRNGR